MDINDLDDDYVKLAQLAMEGMALGRIPGAHWVEYFPIMKWIPGWVPGAGFKKLANVYKPIVEEMAQKPFMEVRDAVVRVPNSLCPPFVDYSRVPFGSSRVWLLLQLPKYSSPKRKRWRKVRRKSRMKKASL